MKKIFLSLLFTLISIAPAISQQIFSNATTLTLTNSDTGKVYLGFYGKRSGSEVVGFTSTVIDPADIVEWSGDLELNFRADTTTATTEYDSLAMYVISLNHEGRPKVDTLWADWENFTATIDSTVEYTSWVPASSPTYDSRPDFSVNLTGKLEPCFGIEIGFIQRAASHTATITLKSTEVRYGNY